MGIPVIEATQIFNQTSNGTSTGAITLSLGTISENDVIIVYAILDGTNGNPTASGNNSGAFTEIVNADQGGAVEGSALWVRQGATPDTTVTVSWTGSEQGRFMLIRISGCLETGNIVDVVAATSFLSSGFATAFFDAANDRLDPPTEADTLYMGFFGVDRDRVDSGDGVISGAWLDTGTAGSSGGATGVGLLGVERDQAPNSIPPNVTVGTWTADEVAGHSFNIKGQPAADDLAPLNINMDVSI
jgi:hypothetical protein